MERVEDGTDTSFPVHESLDVLDGETIYRTDDWFKAAVLYQYGSANSDTPELAIYLWHHDDAWKRKQKYVVRTVEAWHDDKETIEQFLPVFDGDSVPTSVDRPDDTFPVSEYYHVTAGQTVFQTDEWWKAITVIDAKGDYDTTEVILYLWQWSGDEWKCRQKYPIKRRSDWEDDVKHVDRVLQRTNLDNGADDAKASSTARSSDDDEALLKNAMATRHLSRRLSE